MPRQLLFFFVLTMTIAGCSGHRQAVYPGSLSDGSLLLPNGWKLSPAGQQLALGDFPMNLDISPDGKHAIVTNNGYSAQNIMVVDLESWRITQTIPIRRAWLGIRYIDKGRGFLASGGTDNKVFTYRINQGRAGLIDSIVVGEPWPKQKIWLAGLDVDEVKGRAFVAARGDSSVYVLDLATRQVARRISLPDQAYTCLVSKIRNVVYASVWGAASVAVIERSTMSVLRTIPVQEHPTDLVESPDGKRLFVANANRNTVSVVDVEAGSVMETISSALSPDAPPGSTPNSVALNESGSRLYIANADNNSLAVMDVSVPGHSRSLGFIPVGWYPTTVRVIPGNDEIIVANGKGGSSKANPKGPDPVHRNPDAEYIGGLFQGTLSRIEDPSSGDLQEYSRRVYSNTPTALKSNATRTEPNPIPRTSGGSSPVKHVFYIIKENRTYDQVFGDMPEGNGDSSLCLFPEPVTPNQHALAREFVLFDNFYVNAEVSADGHNWSTAAYATDYVEKSWPTNYSGRGGDYDFEGTAAIGRPSSGYLWDNCRSNGVTYRSYGEFVTNGRTPAESATANLPSLEGHVAPYFVGWNMNYSDLDRFRSWQEEFDRYEREGGLPQFQVLRLPNNHTQGTKKGALTPRAYVAQNDLALGLMVERIARSRYWKESAIFVLEDDAQNGPDHVDAHRSPVLVISPYVKRHFVDHTMYSTSGLIRTMELILGLPPMTQYDAAATPMHSAFTMDTNTAPWEHLGARVDVDEKNLAGAYGQERMEQMDLSKEDATPDIEFSRIIWKAVRGESSEMPAPVRSAFVRSAAIDEDDD